MADDATLNFAKGVAGSIQSSQGGTTVNQGADGASGPSVLGDHVDPTQFTKQDDARDSRIKNKMHDL